MDVRSPVYRPAVWIEQAVRLSTTRATPREGRARSRSDAYQEAQRCTCVASRTLLERPIEKLASELGDLPVRVASRYSHNCLEMAWVSHSLRVGRGTDEFAAQRSCFEPRSPSRRRSNHTTPNVGDEQRRSWFDACGEFVDPCGGHGSPSHRRWVFDESFSR